MICNMKRYIYYMELSHFVILKRKQINGLVGLILEKVLVYLEWSDLFFFFFWSFEQLGL